MFLDDAETKFSKLVIAHAFDDLRELTDCFVKIQEEMKREILKLTKENARLEKLLKEK